MTSADPHRADPGAVVDMSAASAAERAANEIRSLIVRGDLGPAQRLVESDLASMVGVSRGAIRQALARLDHEGLVERVANRGARVRAVSLDEAIAITEVRMVVEGLCAAKAAENASDSDREDLRDIGVRMKTAVGAGDVVTYSELNVLLHDRVRLLAAQGVADEVLRALMARNVRYQFKLALRPGRPQVSLGEHLALIDEICAGSPAAAERAARRHVESVIEAMRASEG